MRIVFVYFSINVTCGLNNGIAILSAVLKRAGHEVFLVTITGPANIHYIIHETLVFMPDVIGLSLVETQKSHAFDFCQMIRSGVYKYTGKIIVGGPYPTMDPEEVIKWPIDALCVGEGEDAILQYLQGLSLIPNMWIKQGNEIIKPHNYLLTPLENLPPEDKSLFQLRHIVKKKGHQLEASVGRGCVYMCSFCINQSFLDKYRFTKTEYIRIKKPDTIMQEILPYTLNPELEIEKIAFIDDDFLIYSRYYPIQFEAFYQRYNQQIHLPFNANVNPLSITEKNTEQFKKYGGLGMRIGIESSEKIRRSLRKYITDKVLLNKIDILKHHQIEISTYNMIGLPNETKEDIDSMLDINAIIKPKFVKVSIFYPFEGTPIYNYCWQHNLIDKSKNWKLDNYYTDICLSFSSDYIHHIKHIQDNFDQILNEKIGKKCYHKISESVARRDD